MQLRIILRHAPYRCLALKQPHEVFSDVACPIVVAIQDRHTVSMGASPYASNPLAPPLLQLSPRATLRMAATARLAGVCLRCGRHYKPPAQLAHQPDSDTGRISSVAGCACPPGNHTPRPIRENNRPMVSLHPFDLAIQYLLRLLLLDHALPPSPAVLQGLVLQPPDLLRPRYRTHA